MLREADYLRNIGVRLEQESDRLMDVAQGLFDRADTLDAERNPQEEEQDARLVLEQHAEYERITY